MNQKGTVVKVTGRWFWVETENRQRVKCAVKGVFRMAGSLNTNPVVVGDHVTFTYDKQSDTGLIISLADRTNYIIRKSANLSHQTQILAANIDQALLIVSLTKPKTYPEFIDRFLVSAEAYQIPAILIFNKSDLFTATEKRAYAQMEQIYGEIGYTLLQTSVKSKENIPLFKNIITGKVTLIAGNSGVGKTSLINLIDPSLNLKIKSVSKYHHTGQHTTTYTEMFPLHIGGYLIDTPGIKGFGLVGFDKEELYHFFPEIFKQSSTCTYYNCTHTHEPGCQVKKAVSQGIISESRYRSYLNLFYEEDKKYRL